jgi:hypothetical protein
MRKASRILSISAAALLASCAPVPVGLPVPISPTVTSPAPPAQSIAYYRLDPERSSLTVFVYRGGLIESLGHNHVVEARGLQGFVRRAEPLAASYLEFAFRPGDMVVDDPAARAAAGGDFTSVPSASAIAGTRKNMLGVALLDAVDFPVILVRSRAVTPAEGGATLLLDVQVKDHVGTLAVPVVLAERDGELEASGKVEVSQQALGLNRLMVLGGVIEVRDALRVEFRAVAVKTKAPPTAAAPGAAAGH